MLVRLQHVFSPHSYTPVALLVVASVQVYWRPGIHVDLSPVIWKLCPALAAPAARHTLSCLGISGGRYPDK
jgi:hypothetical protein